MMRMLGVGCLLAGLGLMVPASIFSQDKKKPAEAPKEDSVVAYDSKTHGALQVKSVGAQPVDFFDVLQNGKRAFAGNPKLLNSTLELEGDTNDLTTSFMINTNNDGSFISNSLPAPTVIPPTFI